MAITAGMVKELREKTGVGMMECKKALEETNGDIANAVKWLRERGIAKASSKSGRVAAEGVVEVLVSADGHSGVLVEVNCETDFSARNEDFLTMAKKIAKIALAGNCHSLEDLNKTKFEDGVTIEDSLKSLIAKIGENMSLRRFERFYSSGGAVFGYSHLGGKIGAMVLLEGASVSDTKAAEVGKEIAMHIAASAPKYLTQSQVPTADIDYEKDIARTKLMQEGKPADLVDKILMGHVNKYFKEICLLDQPYTRDPKLSIEKFLKDSGLSATIKSFGRFQLGEGIEKKETNFAEEVAAQVKG